MSKHLKHELRILGATSKVLNPNSAIKKPRKPWTSNKFLRLENIIHHPSVQNRQEYLAKWSPRPTRPQTRNFLRFAIPSARFGGPTGEDTNDDQAKIKLHPIVLHASHTPGEISEQEFDQIDAKEHLANAILAPIHHAPHHPTENT